MQWPEKQPRGDVGVLRQPLDRQWVTTPKAHAFMPESLIPLSLDEMVFSAIRAQGAGGQNVNKVSTAIHLRYDIGQSSLPDAIKERLLALSDQRITLDGVVVIKAQSTRSQDQNKADAIARLQALVDSVAVLPKARKATKPTRSSQRKRLEGKSTRGDVKKLRGKVSGGE
jgi:ribosome-associated protein